MDVDGFAPLVMVVGEDPSAVSLAEAVLAKLRFAVTTSPGVAEATRVLAGLRPDIIVATSADALLIRTQAPDGQAVVIMTDEMRKNPATLIDAIRKTLGRR